MKLIALLLTAIISVPKLSKAQDDIAGSKDYPLLTRLTGFYIYDYNEKEYERFAFIVPQGKDAFIKKDVEGKQAIVSYKNKEEVKASRLQILKNYVKLPGKQEAQLFLTAMTTTGILMAASIRYMMLL